MTTQQTDIEKTLKRILARELTEWPSIDTSLQQCHDGEVVGYLVSLGFMSLASDYKEAVVTRADWEAERALLASEQAQPLGDSEEFDQALWDKVAVAALAKSIGTYPDDSTSEQVRYCFEYADAFMAERAKRIAARKEKK